MLAHVSVCYFLSAISAAFYIFSIRDCSADFPPERCNPMPLFGFCSGRVTECAIKMLLDAKLLFLEFKCPRAGKQTRGTKTESFDFIHTLVKKKVISLTLNA